jgi:hypothetical protein
VRRQFFAKVDAAQSSSAAVTALLDARRGNGAAVSKKSFAIMCGQTAPSFGPLFLCHICAIAISTAWCACGDGLRRRCGELKAAHGIDPMDVWREKEEGASYPRSPAKAPDYRPPARAAAGGQLAGGLLPSDTRAGARF